MRSVPRRGRQLLGGVAFALGVAVLASACTPSAHAPNAPIENAVAAKVVWTKAEITIGQDLSGNDVDQIAVRGGDVLRLAVDHPILIGERVKSGASFAETWTEATPKEGLITLKTTLLAAAILAPKGSIERAHFGHGYDPGYGWFELEADVLAWAQGPIPAPFPAVAPRERIDFEGFAALDKLMFETIERAGDVAAAKKAARAIRSVAGLRAIRALRPVVGFPYFYDHDVVPDGAPKSKKDDGRTMYEVDEKSPLEITVQGPQLLHLWSKAERGEIDDAIRLRVSEGGRQRAVSAAAVPHAPARSSDLSETSNDAPVLMPLHRAIVHVPPGKHTYRVEITGGRAWTYAIVADPVIHLGDAVEGTKDEESLLAGAMHVCDDDKAHELCALTLALLGRDESAVDGPYGKALAGSPREGKLMASMVAEGGPRDPSIALELAASQGDSKALAVLANAGRTSIDDGVRDAWVRGTLRGTRWVVAERTVGPGITTKGEKGETWSALLFDKNDDEACAAATDAPWNELTANDATFSAGTWRGAPTLELLSTIGCDGKGPIGLDVDGEKLSPNPSAPMSKWHVLVANPIVHARRTDQGGGHVYAIRPEAAACGAHFGSITAPKRASTTPKLSYGAKVEAPGVEIWLREGKASGEVLVSPSETSPVHTKIVVRATKGFTAIDDKGDRWVRVARVGLPTWASLGGGGAVAKGGDDVAVRAIVRAPRSVGPDPYGGGPKDDDANGDEAKPSAVPLDEKQLVELSRAILSSTGQARGQAYLKRALLLAAGGATRAAIEDARAAKALSAKGDDGKDPIELVKAALRPMPKKPLTLPSSLKAYGVEPDFDPGAPRCAPSLSGPRAQLAALVDELKTAKLAQQKAFDPKLAIRAFEVMAENPVDPRGPAVLSWALAGSRWTTARALDGSPLKVQRPNDGLKEGALDGDGDLRARVGTGQPFDKASYATITETRPAKAALTGSSGAKAHVEFACVARSPADALDGKCPISVTVGSGAPIQGVMGADGRGSIELPELPPKGAQTHVTLALAPAPGRWEAIARIVFDREVPGTTKVEGVGFVLMPPGLEYRFLLKDGDHAGTTLKEPGLIRIDAVAEPEDHPKVVVVIDGKEQVVTLDGTPKIFAVEKPGPVVVKSLGGAATIVLAERVAKAQLGDPLASIDDVEPDVETSRADLGDGSELGVASTSALLDANTEGTSYEMRWRDIAVGSPRPLTPLEDSLGTVTTEGLGKYGTLRDGDPSTAGADGYLQQSVGYRRKIETLGLWMGFGGQLRERSGGVASMGASGLLYEEWGRLRVAGWAEYWQQDIDIREGKTWKPRGFIEYSARILPNFFLLPRIGYDGYYTNLKYRPVSLQNVDDDVFNDFRSKHQTEMFGQLLAWWVPHIDNIFYLRGRATFDPVLGVLDHSAARPGAFFAIGNAELGFYVDAAWYRATPGVRDQSKVDVTGASYLLYNAWLGSGSVDLQPGLGGRARASDGGWEVFALVNVFASFHRGLRDFTSLELNFPEPLGGGVAWRGAMVAGGGK